MKLRIVAGLLFLATAAYADLEWINGGVPKGTSDKSANSGVKDGPSDAIVAPGANQDIIVSHMITSTNIVNQYPVDSVNFFYPSRHKQVCYYAYFLLKPSSRIHTATVECYSPTGMRIAKFDQQFQVGFTDRLLTVQNETYQYFLVNMTIGLDHLHSEYGQSGYPRDLGLYTLHLTVDGQKVGVTFFYLKTDEAKSATPGITPLPAPAGVKSNALPMSTPLSRSPSIPKGIQ